MKLTDLRLYLMSGIVVAVVATVDGMAVVSITTEIMSSVCTALLSELGGTIVGVWCGPKYKAVAEVKKTVIGFKIAG